MTCQISNVRGNHINLSFVEKVCGYEEINCVMPFPRMRKDIYDNIQRFKFSLPSFCANCSSFQPLNYISNSLCRLGIVSELRSTYIVKEKSNLMRMKDKFIKSLENS